MAGVAGFEPAMQQSKCCVLPLDDTPIFEFSKLADSEEVLKNDLI